jgi:hypothetical protein
MFFWTDRIARAAISWVRLGVIVVGAALQMASAWSAPYTEVLLTTAKFGDIEFDWAREGVYCPQCNGGQGNARFNWVDRNNNLWLGYIDYFTGAMYPQNGRAVLVDTGANYYSDFGNGPEWVFSQHGSQLVYGRYAPGLPQSGANSGIGIASMVNGSWTAGFIDDKLGRITPGPSQSVADVDPVVVYASGNGPAVYWRKLSNPPGPEKAAPWISTGLSVRWLPNFDSGKSTTKLAYVNGSPGSDGKRYQQVFTFDTVSNKTEQLTFDLTEKRGVFMFPAPEFGNDWVFFTVAARTELRIFRYLLDPSGARAWTLVNTITAPPETPYIATPEPFFHNGMTYIFMTTSASKSASDVTIPTNLALTGIDPAVPSFHMLTDPSFPPRLRQDPEYFITANGPYLYFSRAIPGTDSGNPPIHEGTFRIDLGLGPPLR